MIDTIDKDKVRMLMHNIRGNTELYDKISYKHVNSVIYLYIILKHSISEIELKQGWIIDTKNGFKIKPYLYIEVYIDNKKLYLDLIGGSANKDISIYTRLQPWIYKRKPSNSKVEKVKNKYVL